jgi:hypothetical protein
VRDDYHEHAPNHGHEFQNSVYYNDVIEALNGGKDVVLADIIWCKPIALYALISTLQEDLERLGRTIAIELWCFENDPDACRRNVLRRGRPGLTGTELGYIDDFSKVYVIPEAARVLPVYREGREGPATTGGMRLCSSGATSDL